jgi:hypothetical protein
LPEEIELSIDRIIQLRSILGIDAENAVRELVTSP